MRKSKVVAIFSFIFLLSLFAVAGQNSTVLADTYRVNFTDNIRVADTVLPKGDYEIRHVMEGQNHVMVFHQLKSKSPAEVRAKCTLVPLAGKATEDQKIYTVSAVERVLNELIFKGDTVKHVF